MRKIKDNLGTFIITLVVLLLPMLAGMILWNQLPNEIATHWGPDGNPDGYSSRAVAVFAMPAFLLVLHLIGSLATAKKDTNAISDKLFCILLWICPVMSIVITTFIYATALGYKVNMPFELGTYQSFFCKNNGCTGTYLYFMCCVSYFC